MPNPKQDQSAQPGNTSEFICEQNFNPEEDIINVGTNTLKYQVIPSFPNKIECARESPMACQISWRGSPIRSFKPLEHNNDNNHRIMDIQSLLNREP